MKLQALFSLILVLSSRLSLAGPLVRLQSQTFEPKSMLQKIRATPDQKTWLVSFEKPINEMMKSELTQQGFEILGFIPDQSLLVRGEKKDTLSLSFAADWLPYQAGWKWSSALPSPSVHNQSAYRVVMLRAHSVQDAKRLNSILEKKEKVLILNATHQYLVVRASFSDLFAISSLDEVAFLDDLPAFILMNMDLGFAADELAKRSQATGFETGTKVMNMESAWVEGFRG